MSSFEAERLADLALVSAQVKLYERPGFGLEFDEKALVKAIVARETAAQRRQLPSRPDAGDVTIPNIQEEGPLLLKGKINLATKPCLRLTLLRPNRPSPPLILGSNRSRRASPNMLMLKTVIIKASPAARSVYSHPSPTGILVRQTISLEAEVCFKTEGAPKFIFFPVSRHQEIAT